MSSELPGRVRPLRLLAAFVLSVVVFTASNVGLSMIGRMVFSVPDDFCAFTLADSEPLTLGTVATTTVAWAMLCLYSHRPAWWLYQSMRVTVAAVGLLGLLLLSAWRFVLGVVTLDLMVVVGASVTYLALTRLAPPRVTS